MKIKNALAGAAVATLAAVGSLAPAQAAVAEAQVGFAIAKIASQNGWWAPSDDGTKSAILIAAGATLGASAVVSGAKTGALFGAAGGPAGMLIGAAIGAV